MVKTRSINSSVLRYALNTLNVSSDIPCVSTHSRAARSNAFSEVLSELLVPVLSAINDLISASVTPKSLLMRI